MADNNQLVGKWYVADESAEQTEENSLQFYKDGSCLVPVNLLGEENEDYPMYFFYHAFENLTIKFDSGEAGIHMYRFVIEGDSLCLRKLNGEKFFFTKEEKKSKFKINPFEKIKQEKEAEQEKEEREPNENEWKCPTCGKINQNYVGTCGCGEARPEDVLPFVTYEMLPGQQLPTKEEEPVVVEEPEQEPEKQPEPEPEIEPTENEWKCPNCGTINQNYVGTCGCGEPRPADVSPFVTVELPPDVQKMVDAAEKAEEESRFAMEAAKAEEEA
ncbi:MAG: hypothetical protein IIU14_07735 [Ruminococcus sp.]|nr:hypothetical protein [Ruminococcus sp.]